MTPFPAFSLLMSQGRIQHLKRYLRRARHVLTTEGGRALLRKAARRLRSAPIRVKHRPELVRLGKRYQPGSLVPASAPEVSIVIPAHNHCGFTLHCLAALQQRGANRTFEVIVADDGSNDDTAAMLNGWPGLRVVSSSDNLGFVSACNAGAAAARGEYLVFLNNDTQVQSGWLDALIDTFQSHRHAGIVGSRLIYPDGRLQEAGGIVFADASGWNYGHLDDPYKPQYSYLREPDYVSGASLAIRRALFERLGGFDEAFAPAYYEDMDLAFRVRAAGYRVFYQPLSIVVHFEGVSAGADETAGSGLKRFQAINRRTFYHRWRAILAGHGERAVDLEQQKERRIHRRAFIADVYMLTPDRESGSLRMANLFSILQEFGFKITFASCNLEALQPYVSDLQKQGVEVLYRPYAKSIERHLKGQGEQYDLVLLSRTDTAAHLMNAARRYCPNARVVYDTVDLRFLREKRFAALNGDEATRKLAKSLERQEIGLIARADTTLVVSTAERELLARAVPDADVRVVSNIHHLHGSRKGFDERSNILFIGSFAHPPNTDSVLWFCRKVFPSVLEHEPDIELFVIGADPPQEIQALAAEPIRVLGHVPDVGPYFDGCRLSIAPLRYGAGVKGKVNQSLAYGLPVVATTVAVEGMYLDDGKSVLLADEACDFATQILHLYRNPDLWEALSDNGLAVMETHFGFAAARRALGDLVGT